MRCLTVGAIYYGDKHYSGGGNARLLRCQAPADSVAAVLRSGWDIDGPAEAVRTIDACAAGEQHARAYDQNLVAFKLSPDFGDMVEPRLSDYFRHTGARLLNVPELFAACQTTLAWDLERAAMLSRHAATIGYIDEDTAWQYLAAIRQQAERTFASWPHYATSFLVGRAMWDKDYWRADEGFGLLHATSVLLRGKQRRPSLWDEYPLR
jgi:hypothetical protein